jgi:hypothetical protein
MGLRIKIGPALSIGRTGLRFHVGGRGWQASAGAGGGRFFAALGAAYINARTKGKR